MAYVREEVRAATGINFLIGLWLVLAPFATWFTEVQTALWNSVLVGSALMILSLIEAVKPLLWTGFAWVSFAIGVWLFFSPFLLGFSFSLAPTLIHLCMGAMVAALALGSIIGARWEE